LKGVSAYDPAGTGYVRRARTRFTVRQWSVRQARLLELVYTLLARMLLMLHPLWLLIGYQRAERPVVAVESLVKSFLFDCRMCGRCVLGETGMSCPMNCPKSLRNGPCGGVRANGNCEVEPEMPCVWVEAWTGAQNMKMPEVIMPLHPAVDHSLRGTSSWLRATAEKAAGQQSS
jgi:hypothetical protein